MTGMARKLALTAVATFVVGVALATSAHADDSAVNLPLTDEVRAELVEAALYANPGEYWAGVQLQDQNSYMAFMKPGIPGATWIPTAIGFGPIPAGQNPCPLPEEIRGPWNWPTGKCYPPPAP
jgi:hypothetical protein